MSFIFLSYSRQDSAAATQLVSMLKKDGHDVFWDKEIRFGEDHKKVIVDRLETAACVLVLWSKHSADSHWVNYEAQSALDRKSLVEVRLDDSKPPPPFGVLNTANLSSWKAGTKSLIYRRLLESINARVGPKKTTDREFTLAAPLSGQSVTDSHISLIHTCWRSPQFDDSFGGVETYRWDVALYGSTAALDRVEEVRYYLHPAYDVPGVSSALVTLKGAKARRSCFSLRQIANGHSLVRAHVKIHEQSELVRLSRYINLFDSKANIAEYAM